MRTFAHKPIQEMRRHLFLWTSRSHLATVLGRVASSKGAVIFLPSIGWNIVLFQRPHYLAREFARQGYVSIFDCSNARDELFGFREIEPNLFLFRGPQELLHEIPRPILWTFPYNFQLSDGFPAPRQIVYDWIDDLEVFPHDPGFLQSNHLRALREASLVTTVSVRLHEMAIAIRSDAVCIPNGVEHWRFADDVTPIPRDPDCASLQGEGKPIAGYYGALARWINYDMLNSVAEMRTDWNFLLIGPDLDGSVRGQSCLHRQNLRWIGPRDYISIAGYLRVFNVAIIPFLINAITLAASPLKLYEYFAGGKPVIATPIPECQVFPEVIIARDASEFSEALDITAAAARDPVFRQRLRALGHKHSWNARVRTIMECLDHLS